MLLTDDFWKFLEDIVNAISNTLKNIASALNKFGIISYDNTREIRLMISSIATAINLYFESKMTQ
ncbi:hypothetical protein FE392_12240 [Xenorhabdus sp. 12]|uniref:Uncharacterized protein n=1 Tax=Xenorhabdus santafensis TaxID=2582833 RepID=A0ABU4SBF4_9GAMM|nr:hypothetical protein [Xenorhabdus sp. 12]MDX7988095.1 hypothetical protein [Xenorhabdus sp. 12]